MDSNRQIAFTADKHGRRLAYRWSIAAGGRWFRISLATADAMVASEVAHVVEYRRAGR